MEIIRQMEDRVKPPEHIKHYNFIKQIVEQFVKNYDDFIEEVKVKEKHSKFLIKYNLDKHVNWVF